LKIDALRHGRRRSAQLWMLRRWLIAKPDCLNGSGEGYK
jgi:hypothetical protein